MTRVLVFLVFFLTPFALALSAWAGVSVVRLRREVQAYREGR